MKKLTSTAGYSLVETLVAITILMLAIAGPLTIAFKGMQSAQFAKEQTTAFLLAQEGIEAVTYIRNEFIIRSFNGAGGNTMQNVWDWVADNDLDPCFVNDEVSFAADGDVGCNLDFRDSNLRDSNSVADCSTISNCLMDYSPSTNPPYRLNNGAASNDSQFTRVISLEHVNNREIKVTSEVSWRASIFDANESVQLRTYLFKLFDGLP